MVMADPSDLGHGKKKNKRYSCNFFFGRKETMGGILSLEFYTSNKNIKKSKKKLELELPNLSLFVL